MILFESKIHKMDELFVNLHTENQNYKHDTKTK